MIGGYEYRSNEEDNGHLVDRTKAAEDRRRQAAGRKNGATKHVEHSHGREQSMDVSCLVNAVTLNLHQATIRLSDYSLHSSQSSAETRQQCCAASHHVS